MYTPTPFSQAFARPAPEFQPPASRTSLAERRTIRSSGTADALILALSAAANRGDMDAVLIADDDGMLVCNSVSRLDLAPVAAVVPIVARGRATARVRRAGQERELSVTSERIGGELLHIAGLGGDADGRTRELRRAVDAARRILM